MIKPCIHCYQEMIEELKSYIYSMNGLKKIIDKAPHSGNCKGFPPTFIDGKWDTSNCDCWKSKVEEIYNG